MRLFYAVQLPQGAKEFLAKIQGTIKNNSIKGNFSFIDNLHLTLAFIGEVDERREKVLREILHTSFEGEKEFSLVIKGLGNFKRGNKDIVWAGLEESQELLTLQQILAQNLTKEGFSLDNREFKPHITLGREVVLKEGALDIPFSPFKFTVEKISLMNSLRVKGRLVYIPIETVNLIKGKKT
ncbi:RNA 2',3'-cyclic phosphodiesterase [Anaerobranca gottschalkii]|uniref:RNA 2',3'-cyclic phosphodiesterase n=1 Tax=Anaerobranca gottschalkii DSM 13577 TaxID=1120990 RepID=A0A1I0C0Y4_9FIRM|nr:RNA 2',3'-cyclic phosphodiesterase [Anaerobranca gottschalkii]SET12635.1 2'-5' RNA ligase [Anaerobranca gottschalkii DSM 13577]